MSDLVIGAAAWVALIFGSVCLSMVVVRVMFAPEERLKREAIDRGYAQHNPKTGKWEWK